MLIPVAIYNSESSQENYQFNPGEGPHETNGKTTQISDIVINAGGEDRDKPSMHKDTPLGHLRASLTTLQDQINVFLTERMKLEKYNNKKKEQEFERKLLDEGAADEKEGAE
ncbi:GON7 [Candida oxycetoniae]|uniref:EKC/KEOPS complex subunit GON7 n=1 Tax=Candida oxycetoniae TaxID=497107 RepID=A0AAI9WYD9_9ASCO|nr:GON7 [Candida oxycetoniae]KAI3404939.1 GON7 [Candida oxycetoniae]